MYESTVRTVSSDCSWKSMGQNTIHSPLNRHFSWYTNQSRGENTWKIPLLPMKKTSSKKKSRELPGFFGVKTSLHQNSSLKPNIHRPSLAPFKVKFPLNSNDVPLSFSSFMVESLHHIPPRKGITSQSSYLCDAYMQLRLVVKTASKT